MNVTGLAHIGLFIKNLEETKKFYKDVLGFDVFGDFTFEDGTKICFAKAGTLEMELVELPVWEDRKDGLFDHVAIAVEDIYAAKAELEKKGCIFESEIVENPGVHGGVRYVMFRGGPDNVRYELEQFGL